MSDHHHNAPPNPYHTSNRNENRNNALTERVAKIEALLAEKGLVSKSEGCYSFRR